MPAQQLPFRQLNNSGMIGISRLYMGQAEPSDRLRYKKNDRKPIVVWNITRKCNLRCLHCYADADASAAREEAGADEAKQLIDELAEFGIPVLLFSGGEPLTRPDLPELAAYASKAGLRTVVSTNGTLITPEVAQALQNAGVSYVGVSIDGTEETHNLLRGHPKAHAQALDGLGHARRAGLKAGLRITLTRSNQNQIKDIFKILREREINRVCFYHLVCAGRGKNLGELALSPAETRRALDTIIDETGRLFESGCKKEVLTVDNHADGPYLWMRLCRENPERAKEAWNLLSISGGDSSGQGIAAINWRGDVLPDQFWQSRVLGNVREHSFSQIWAGHGHEDGSALEFLTRLRDKRNYLQGRCANCRFLGICGGNFRARAEMLTGNLWAADPACYLSDREIEGAPPYSD